MAPSISRRRPSGATRWICLLLAGMSSTAAAQMPRDIRVSTLGPRYHLLSAASGNLVLYVDDTVSLAAGYHSPTLVRAARTFLDSLRAPPVKWALILESDSAKLFADGEWGATGAITIADENLRLGITQHLDSLRRTGTTTRAQTPPIGFADVLQVILPHEDTHFAHRPRGITIRDVIVHFHHGHIVMLGNLLSADEYPSFTNPRKVHVTNLMDTMDWFTDSLPRRMVEPIVPGRGAPVTVQYLRDYRAMLATTLDRVAKLHAEGKSEADVIAARPTAEFDARWGRGRVTPEQFVRMLYRAVGRT